jgi:hypothetical protein
MDLLVSTAAHDDILLVVVGVEARAEEHLALPEAAQHLPGLRVPQLHHLPTTEVYFSYIQRLAAYRVSSI